MNWFYRLGERRLDLTNRTLVMGILNRTPDSFYDGGETVHKPKIYQAKEAHGYNCEEVGGLAVSGQNGIQQIERLSINFPLFRSPKGTGSSRYIDILERPEGYYATWQQSQNDLSQPLVMNFLSRPDAESILA